MKNYKLIPKITLWVLMACGIICSVMFYLPYSEGSLEVAGDFLNIPRFTNLMLFWNYALLALVCLVTLAFVLVKYVGMFRTNVKKALVSTAVVIGFVALVLICWGLGSPEQMHIVGYEGSDNVGAMARLSDACLYLTYILLCATVLTMAGGYIYTKLVK
jgi:hypothetical protein